jgi:hypothetical protein
MVSSSVCDLAPELQTFEIPEGFMKHPVFFLELENFRNTLQRKSKFEFYIQKHYSQKFTVHEKMLKITVKF